MFVGDKFYHVNVSNFGDFNQPQIIQFAQQQSETIAQLQRENAILKAQNKELTEQHQLNTKLISELKQKNADLNEQLERFKKKKFGKKKDKNPRSLGNSNNSSNNNQNDNPENQKKEKVQKLSDRYPNAPIVEQEIKLEKAPHCKCCGSEMHDSGMQECAEILHVIPKQYIIIRQKRAKYRCSDCHGDIVTAPGPSRILEGAAYSDDMICDVAMSKYCDLIPVERYASMADREGLENLPPNSLIETTHKLADFVEPIYELIKQEVLSSQVLHADETTHRMLEGDKKQNWFLWGFSTPQSSYFELRDTRSGSVASELLVQSMCQYLVSDLFSGYGKSIRETNVIRKTNNLPEIQNVLCNAHSRRKFHEALDSYQQEATFFIDCYGKIYHLESLTKGKPPDEVLYLRSQMLPIFESMKIRIIEQKDSYSTKSSICKAMSYFYDNYEGFILFTKHHLLPIDNNSQERQLRNPVIGRKTWYGTHSKRGAKTAAILFSLVESCKLNQVNPRLYLNTLVKAIHAGKPGFTPKAFAAQI